MFGVGGSVFSNDCLWKHHLFADRDPRFVELLSRDVQVEVFRPGELIVKEGAKGNSMYILRRGTVEVLAGGEKSFFEHLARQRLAELKLQAAGALQGQRQKAAAVSRESCGTLPPLADEGFAEKSAEYASVLTAFSRFFEKPSFRAGKLKKSPLQQPASQAVSELVELEKYRPRLPPLIARNHTGSWNMDQTNDYADKSDQDLPDGASQLLAAKGDAAKAGAGGGAFSPRSTSPRSPSPKQRFFMYEKGAQTGSPGGWRSRRMASPTSAQASPPTKQAGGDGAHSARGANKDGPHLLDETPDLA